MIIPRTVKIGAARWRVRIEDTIPDINDDCKEILGCTIYATETISIAKTHYGREVAENCIADTFLHEIVHAVSTTYGLELTENQVAGLSGGLLAALRDNKLDFHNREDAMACKGKGKKKGKGK